jgi:hypothetical protein
MAPPEAEQYPVTVHFYGLVLPRLTSISLDRIRRVRWNMPERDLRLHLLAEIKESQIHIEIRANKYALELFAVFHKCAFDVSRTAVELMAFTLGAGLYVELVDFVGPDGIRKPMGCWTYPNLSRLCTSYSLENGFERMWEVVQVNQDIFGVLNDLIASITTPHVSVVNCARAIDGIRHLISAKKNDWAAMHQALRVNAPYLMFISEHSKGPRHGNRGFVDGPTVNTILERSWMVMNRFLEYRKRNCGDLPESEFPTLTG